MENLVLAVLSWYTGGTSLVFWWVATAPKHYGGSCAGGTKLVYGWEQPESVRYGLKKKG